MATTSGAMEALGATRVRGSALTADWRAPDVRRMLQLALATIWLLDAVLQFQPYMFSRAFGTQMIAGMAHGNPGALAHQIVWAGRAIGDHAMLSNTAFALIQLLIALGIAWRPTVKVALATSVVWSLGVWWIGEGLGGVLTGTESPFTGAPGAVVLYALLAVLLWPAYRPVAAPFIAARPLGAPVAKAFWLVLWGSMAFYALQGPNRASQGLHDLFRIEATGQPHWLSSLGNAAASLVAHRGLEFSIVVAVLFALIGAGAFLSVALRRATLVAAVVVSVVIWVVGEGLGDVFSGSGTDPNTGPLLILLALAFWPRPVAVEASGGAPALAVAGK